MNIAKPLLLAIVVASLTACGGGGGGSSNAPAAGDNTSSSPVTTETPTPSTSSPSTPNEAPVTSEPPVTSDPNGTTSEPGDDQVQSGENETPAPAPDPLPTETTPIISLSWTIPAAREDGSYLPVYEIAGYEVRYSKDQGTDVTVIRINDPQKTDWVIENATPGQYEFSIATIDSEGVYSEFSTQTTTQVP